MNHPTIYDPCVADQAHDRLTDGMINLVNQNHREAKQAEAVSNIVATLQTAQAAQVDRYARREARLHAELRKHKQKEKRTCIGLDFMLLAASRIAYEAMCSGAIKFNLSLPLALAATLYGGWLLCAWWRDTKKKEGK